MLHLKRSPRPLSVRRRVDSKILRFSFTIGAIGLVLAGVLYAAAFYPTVKRWQRINRRALAEIKCSDTQCDSTDFASDWDVQPDYVIDVRDRYFINAPSSSTEDSQHYTPLDFADTGFIRKFREPASYHTPDGEVWRLCSRTARFNGRNAELLVGHAEKSSTNMLETPQSALPAVDTKLKSVADRIAESLGKEGEVGKPSKLSVDGFEIVASDDGSVLYRGPWVPSFLPSGKLLPLAGTRLYFDSSELYVDQTDVNGPLCATSLIQVGSVPWLIALAVLAFVTFVSAARWGARRFLRNYFALSNVRVPELKDALQQGEGQRIEFKRALSPDEPKHSSDTEVLKSVAAFANTNDGAIFVGVDDRGAVTGLQLDYKKRDMFSQRISSLVRSHIRPIPPVQIVFEEMRGLVVAKIAVARGAESFYVLNGAIYVRSGSSDVLAQAEDYKRMLAES